MYLLLAAGGGSHTAVYILTVVSAVLFALGMVPKFDPWSCSVAGFLLALAVFILIGG